MNKGKYKSEMNVDVVDENDFVSDMYCEIPTELNELFCKEKLIDTNAEHNMNFFCEVVEPKL